MSLQRDGIHTSGGNLKGQMEGADLARWIAEVRDELDTLVQRIDGLIRLCATPDLGESFAVQEGPFAGDALAVLEATRLWLERSRLMLYPPARAMANAHVAAGGLASSR